MFRDKLQAQLLLLLLLPSPATTHLQAQDPARCFGCLPSSRSFSSALHPLPTTCCVSWDHSHAMGRSGWSLGSFAMLLVSNTPGIPCPGHRGHPSLLLTGGAPSSPAGGFGPLPGQGLSKAVRPLWPSLEGQTGNLQCKRFRQMEKKRGKFHPEHVHVHPRLLLFATSYRSSAFRPQMSFRLVESLFTSAGFGSGPS